MSTSQRAVMLCSWGLKAGMACLQVTLCVAIPERFGKCYSILRCFTNVQDYFTFYFTNKEVFPDL